jgi:hypothetical protein
MRLVAFENNRVNPWFLAEISTVVFIPALTELIFE